MDHKQFVTRLSRRASLDYKETSALVQAVCRAITDCLKDDNAVAMPGFGTLSTVKEDEREVIDRVTGKRLLLPPCISIQFRQSASIGKRIES